MSLSTTKTGSTTGRVRVEGPKGRLYVDLQPFVRLEYSPNSLLPPSTTTSSSPLSVPNSSVISVLVTDPAVKHQRAIWGLTRSLIANAVSGVSAGYTLSLRLVGVGYRAVMEERPGFGEAGAVSQRINLKLGYAHPVLIDLPTDVFASTPTTTTIVLTGIDKQRLGEVAARIRRWRRPEPYNPPNNCKSSIFSQAADLAMSSPRSTRLDSPSHCSTISRDNTALDDVALALASPTHLLEAVDKLKFFLATAPSGFPSPHANMSTEERALNRFLLPTGEQISCVMWNGLYHVTGTDIVRALNFRFLAFGRPVRNAKKFEEGVFSDLRNLKSGTDATLEEPKSEFLELLFKHNCIRTQKKQKVFYWFSVPHDRLFLDALDRDLKREKLGQESTTEAVREPALSFRWNPSKTLFEQFSAPNSSDSLSPSFSDSSDIPDAFYREENPLDHEPAQMSDDARSPANLPSGESQRRAAPQRPLVDGPVIRSTEAIESSTLSLNVSVPFAVDSASTRANSVPASLADAEADVDASNIFGAVALFEGSPTYKQRRRPAGRKKSASVTPGHGLVAARTTGHGHQLDERPGTWNGRSCASADFLDDARSSTSYGDEAIDPSSPYASTRPHRQSHAESFEPTSGSLSTVHPSSLSPFCGQAQSYRTPLDSRLPMAYRNPLPPFSTRAPYLSSMGHSPHEHSLHARGLLPTSTFSSSTSSQATSLRTPSMLDPSPPDCEPSSGPRTTKTYIKIHDKLDITTTPTRISGRVRSGDSAELDNDDDVSEDADGDEEDLSGIMDGMEEPRYRSRSTGDEGVETVRWESPPAAHMAASSLISPRVLSSGAAIPYHWSHPIHQFQQSHIDHTDSQVSLEAQASQHVPYHANSSDDGGSQLYRRFRSATPGNGHGTYFRSDFVNSEPVARQSIAPHYGYATVDSVDPVSDAYPSSSFQTHNHPLSSFGSDYERPDGAGSLPPSTWALYRASGMQEPFAGLGGGPYYQTPDVFEPGTVDESFAGEDIRRQQRRHFEV
ncbi:transcription factor STE12, partial [Phenoliferia sp. Uapishka_3]